jgi:integrase
MSIYKREKTYWTDFSVNGQRYRESLDTSDWRAAQSREKDLIAQASTGKLAPSGQQFSRLAFSEAADRYLESRKIELSTRSFKKERQLLVHPRQFFGATSLSRFDSEGLFAYRNSRAKKGLKPSYLNMEMGVIRRILKRGKRWHIVADDIRPLKERHDLGRALAPEQKLKLLRIAGSRPEWETALFAAILALNTTMRGCEIKGLRWRDINLLDCALTIRRSKTEAGERVIPLNADAMGVILELYERAQIVNGVELDHYVFPACENGRIDPTRSQESWRTAWRNLTQAIVCPACRKLQSRSETCRNVKCNTDHRKISSSLAGLRFHDLRHHAITELAESQASDQTIMAIAGHVSPKMLAHYSHVRLAAKRTALDSLAQPQLAASNHHSRRDGNVTNHVTNATNRPAASPYVIGKYGRPVRTRTADLYRVKAASLCTSNNLEGVGDRVSTRNYG